MIQINGESINENSIESIRKDGTGFSIRLISGRELAVDEGDPVESGFKMAGLGYVDPQFVEKMRRTVMALRKCLRSKNKLPIYDSMRTNFSYQITTSDINEAYAFDWLLGEDSSWILRN